jgi:hypothetical protein
MSPNYSCRKASELLSRAIDEPLRWPERLRLRLHLSLCGDCRNVQEQLRQLHVLGGRLFEQDADDGGPRR